MGWKTAGLRALRWILWLIMGWVLLRGVFSFLPAPPPPPAAPQQAEPANPPEPAGIRAFPAMFVREYLTWQANQPDEHAARLRPYVVRNLDHRALWGGSRDGIKQAVTDTWVYDARQSASGRWLVTVAAHVTRTQTVTEIGADKVSREVSKPLPDAVIYLAVPVAVLPGGALAVYDYPALVPEPAAPGSYEARSTGQEVTDKEDRVRSLLTGFFKAYLAGEDVTYYLSPGVKLRTARNPWAFDSLAKVSLRQEQGAHKAWAEVAAVDAVTGARYTLTYTVNLTERDGRWYVEAIHQKGD